jgi:hypothetical protein
MTTNNCCEEIVCIPPRFLSEEATNEILGEDLCFLIAIAKNGKPVRFLPYGITEMSAEFNSTDEEMSTILEFSIRVPKEPDTSNLNTLLANTNPLQRCVPTMAFALCICGGTGGQPPHTCRI